MSSAASTLSRRVVYRNTAAVLVARGIDIAAGLVTVWLVAPYLGPAGYGDYAWVWAFVLAFQPLVNFEMDRILIREAARDGSRTRALWGAGLVVKGILLVPYAGVVVGVALLGALPPEMAGALLLAGASEVLYHLHMLHSSMFQSRERMDADLALMVLFRLTLLGVFILGVKGGHGLPFFFLAAILANGARTIFGGALALWRFGVPVLRNVGGTVRFMLGAGAPLTVAAAVAALTLNVDVFVLKALAPPEHVGYFQLAHPIVLQLQIIPGALMTALFPRFSRAFTSDPGRLAGFMAQAAQTFFLIGGVLGLALWSIADLLVALLGSGKFGPAGPVLSLLALSLPAVFGMTLYTFAIVAADGQRELLWGSLSGLLVNTSAAVALVPSLHALGAAWATLMAYVAMAVGYALIASRRLPGALPMRVVLRMALATIAGLLGLATAWASLPRPAVAITAAAAFVAVAGRPALDALRALMRPAPN